MEVHGSHYNSGSGWDMLDFKNTTTISNAGFTLMELLIAMVVSGIVIAGAVLVFTNMVRSNNTQNDITALQQNMRAAMFYMERSIRMAGYDPTDDAGAGFTTMRTNRIAFTVDKGKLVGTDIDNDPNGVIDSHWEEQVEFRLNGLRLERVNAAGVGTLVAEDIDALNFVYLDAEGNPTSAASDVRSVQVTLVGRTGAQAGYTNTYINNNVYRNRSGSVVLPAQNDNIRRMALTTNVSCRNL